MTAAFPASSWRHQRAATAPVKGDPERRGRWRVAFAMLGFAVLYSVLGARLVVLGMGADEPLVGFVGSILGRADLLAIVYQQRPADLVHFVDDVVKKLPGVIDVRTEPILQLVKNDVRWGLVRPRER